MPLWIEESEGDTMMKGNGMRCIAAVLAAGLLLCGCGGGTSENAQTAPPQINQGEEEQQYLELVVEDEEIEAERDGSPLWENIWTHNETKVYVAEDKIPYMVQKMEDGSKKIVQPWKKNWEKKFKKKFIEPGWYQLLNEQTMYILAEETSMDPEKFYDNRKKYKDDFYSTHFYLLRIDVTTGEMEDIPIPQTTYEQFYKKKGEALPADTNGKEVFWYDIRIQSNGNYILSDYEKTNWICNGVTGEKLADFDYSASGDGLLRLVVGEDFLAAVTFNYSSHKCTLRLYDGNTGKEQYTVPLDFQESTDVDGTPFVNFAIGVSGSTIAFVYDRCIYTMEYGDDQLEKVVDAEKDKTYYLPDEEMIYGNICMGEEDDFFVRMDKESEPERIYHYFKKGTEKNEG